MIPLLANSLQQHPSKRHHHAQRHAQGGALLAGRVRHLGNFEVPEKVEAIGGRGRTLHLPESTPRGAEFQPDGRVGDTKPFAGQRLALASPRLRRTAQGAPYPKSRQDAARTRHVLSHC